MTELEKMQRAKLYLDKLANGIDPISDEEMSGDCTLNNVRLSRCFFYVSDILRQVIENGGVVKRAKRSKCAEFEMPMENRKEFPYSKEPLTIREFVAQINALIDTQSMKKLTSPAITGWLLEKGFLEPVKLSEAGKSRLPTKQGEAIGITTEQRFSAQFGAYRAVLYNEEAQRFIIDNIDAILESYKNKKSS